MTANGSIMEVAPSFLEGDRFDVSGMKDVCALREIEVCSLFLQRW